MKKIAILFIALISQQLSFAGSTDYQKLPMEIQEEFVYLWLHEMTFQGNLITRIHHMFEAGDIDVVSEWNRHKIQLDRFDEIFRNATIDNDLKYSVGSLVYSHNFNFWNELFKYYMSIALENGESYKGEIKNLYDIGRELESLREKKDSFEKIKSDLSSKPKVKNVKMVVN